jgi:hypothetical protein
VNRWSIGVGASLLGTAKRMRSFPFTYDQTPGPDRVVIAEKGAAAEYWAKKPCSTARAAPGNTIAVEHFACAYRNGLGRVVLMQTTERNCGPGKYTLVTRRKRDDLPEPTINAALALFETNNIIQLTASQRTPEWFNQRRFRITGTGALALWRHFASYGRLGRGGELLSTSVKATCTILGLKHSSVEPSTADCTDDVDASEDRIFTRDELSVFPVAQLKAICRLKLLPVSGNKSCLIERLLSSNGLIRPEAEHPVLELLLEKWFMSPLGSSTAMREGTLNEANVLPKLGVFLSTHSDNDCRLQSYKEYGLLCAKDAFYAAFSPDAIAVVDVPYVGQVTAVVEIKSKCTTTTVQKETSIAQALGALKYVAVNGRDPNAAKDFQECIPEQDHRAQVLHGMACGHLLHALYIVASLRTIIRVVHVHIDEDTMDCYRLALQEVYERNLTWIPTGKLPAYLERCTLPRYACDADTIGGTLSLWTAIDKLVKERGRPLPEGRMLIPTIVAMWNRNKGPIDVFSRFMKNCHSRHAMLSAIGNIWLRLLMTRVYNAYQTFVLSRSVAFLVSDDCSGYASFQKHRKKHGSFAKFCSALAKDLTLDNFMRDDGGGDDDSSMDAEGNEMERRDDEVRTICVRYCKRDAYFSKRDMIAKRLNTSLPHVPCRVPDKKPKSCVWCCRRKHSHPDPMHTRHGRTTMFMCLVCNVSLCRVKRYDGKSCHELFHSSATLVDYCRAAMDDVVHVVPHPNRPGPPNGQRRVTSPVIAENSGTPTQCDDDEQPRRRIRRSRVTPVMSARRRRTYRAHSHGHRGRVG